MVKLLSFFMFVVCVGALAEGYQMVIPNTQLPSQCSTVSAVYDGDDSAFLFCRGTYSRLLVYSMSTGSVSIVGELPVHDIHSSIIVVWAGNGRIFYIAEDTGIPGTSTIWELHVCNLSEWTPVAVLQLNTNFASAVWDEMDLIYIIGGTLGGELAEILQFSISTYEVQTDGNKAALNQNAASIWVPSENSVYSFGGSFPTSSNRSHDILKYQPQTGASELYYDRFPDHIRGACDFWVEETASAFIVCGNYSAPRLNMLRFTSLEEDVVTEHVVGFGFSCHWVGCVYSEKLRRAYLFGGLAFNGYNIMYIDMSDGVGDDNISYRAQSILSEETCPTPSPSTDTTTSGSTTTTTTEPTSPGLRVRMSDILIPSNGRCGNYFSTSAAYNGGDSVFISCLGEFFIYSISTDRITASGEINPPGGGTDWAGHAWVGKDTIYRFEGRSRNDNLTSIWKISASNPSMENWELVANISEHFFYHGRAVWDGVDSIYLFASDYYVRDPVVKKFSITDNSVKDAGQLPQPSYKSGVVWDEDGDGAFIFGGRPASRNISRYDPQKEETTILGELPTLMLNPCAVWTGKEALLLCGYSSNYLVRFNPLTNETQTEFVQDWPTSSCYDPGCIYSPALNRVYIFGGFILSGIRPAPIMYIDLDVDPTPSSTTAEPTTGSEQPSTQSASTSSEIPVDLPRCRAFDKYNVLYEAVVGQHAANPCPGISNGTATWFCVPAGRFEGINPDYSNCTSLWLDPGKETIGEGDPITFIEAKSLLMDIRRHLQESVDPSKNVTYFGHEIQIVFRVGQGLVELLENSTRLQEVEELSGITYSIFNLLVMYHGPLEELSQRQRSETGTAFLTASDALALEVGHRHMLMVPLTRYRKEFNANRYFEVLAGVEPTDGNGSRVTFPQEYNPIKESYIEISADWVNHFPDDARVPFGGLELNSGIANYIFLNNGSNINKIVNGPFLSFTFAAPSSLSFRRHSHQRLNFTDYGVRITFQHEVPAWGPERAQLRRRLHVSEAPKAVLGSGVCVYWDEEHSIWSSSGCRLVSSTSETTVCECNHLSAFAVIMDLHNYIGKDLALEIMTWALSSISILCLALSIGVFLYSRYGRPFLPKHPRNDLTLYLCIALLVANILILTTMDKDTLHLSDATCSASAVALHYSLLVAFAWMALEGILLAKLVFLDVFASGREYSTWENAAALLVPGVIVGVTYGVNFGRGDHGYGNEAFCWLNETYLWSFIAIASAVIIFNASVLAMSIRKSYQIHKSHGRTKSAHFWLRGAMSLSLILGLTWVSGFLMLIGNSTLANIAAYVFTATNASQGIFIFVFHIASSKRVRSHFRSLTLTTHTSSGGGVGVGRGGTQSSGGSEQKLWKKKGQIATNHSNS